MIDGLVIMIAVELAVLIGLILAYGSVVVERLEALRRESSKYGD